MTSIITADVDVLYLVSEVRRPPGVVLDLNSGTGRWSILLIERRPPGTRSSPAEAGDERDFSVPVVSVER
jgi:hypothetical protein